MPTFDRADESFAPITEQQRSFVEALVAHVDSDVVRPVLTQFDGALTSDDGSGWLDLRVVRGDACAWPERKPFDVRPMPAPLPGPQTCWDIMLWFDERGYLSAVEFLMIENAPLDFASLAAWLRGHWPPVATER